MSTAAGDRCAPAAWTRGRAGWLLPASLLALLGVLVAAPIVMLVVAALQQGHGPGLGPLRAVLSETGVIANTLYVSGGSTLLAVAIGAALAFLLVRTDISARALLERLVIVPLYVTGLLTAIGWYWLGSPRAGLLNILLRDLLGSAAPDINLQSSGGVVFVMAMSSVPLPFLLVAGALRGMDPALEESARVQGASLGGAWRRITLPLILPALCSSALLVFVHNMGLFAIPAVLAMPIGFNVVGTEIYTLLTTYPPRLDRAAAWGLVLFLATAVLVWLQALLMRHRSFVTITGKAFRPRVIALGRLRPALAALVWLYLALAVALPVLALVWAASINFLTVRLSLMHFGLEHFRYILFEYPKTWQAIWNSFVLGLASATLVCALGLLAAWAMVRQRSRFGLVIDLLAMAPVAIPSLTFALGLLWLYAGLRWLPVYGTATILLLAYVAHFLPYGVRAANGALRQLHPELEEAARVCGAGWRATLRLITLPLTMPTLSAVWILVFVMAMQEVSASILLYSNRSITISVTVYTLWDQGNLGGLAALSVLHLAVMFLLVGVVLRRRQGGFMPA